jgi:hypothetical protein
MTNVTMVFQSYFLKCKVQNHVASILPVFHWGLICFNSRSKHAIESSCSMEPLKLNVPWQTPIEATILTIWLIVVSWQEYISGPKLSSNEGIPDPTYFEIKHNFIFIFLKKYMLVHPLITKHRLKLDQICENNLLTLIC